MAEGLLSGVLPEIYSRTNAFKRRLIDALRNPGDTLRNVRDNTVDDIKRADQMLTDATNESTAMLKSGQGNWVRGGPATERLTQAMIDAYNPMGITVWHGSPHRFIKFDRSKIGAGEGAQVYGHGHYVAESDLVAKEYARANQGRGAAAEGLIDALPKYMQTDVYNAMQMRDGPMKDAMIADVLARYPEAASVVKAKTGNLYKIDLPDEHVAKMLDWDRPLNQQPLNQRFPRSVVKNPDAWGSEQYLLNTQIGGNEKTLNAYRTKREALAAADALTGKELYQWMGMGSGPWKVSNTMADMGVPGIRYLDQRSRGAGKGTSNFVVFPGNEDLLTIQEINGQPVEAVIDALRKRK